MLLESWFMTIRYSSICSNLMIVITMTLARLSLRLCCLRCKSHFVVQATVITIINYNHNTFIVQATDPWKGLYKKRKTGMNVTWLLGKAHHVNERWIKCSLKIRICWLEQVLRIDFNVCISKSRIDLMNFPHKMMHFLQFEYGYTNSQSFKHEVGTAGNNVIKCFCSLFYALENKLDCFGLVTISPQSNLCS